MTSFKCKECGYETPNKSNLNRHNKLKHNKVSEKDKKYECKLCKYESLDKNDLIRHNLTKKHQNNVNGVSNKKKYICPTCEYTTKDPANYNKHKKVHLADDDDEKYKHYKYKCKACNTYINSNNDFITHLISKKHGYNVRNGVIDADEVLLPKKSEYINNASRGIDSKKRHLYIECLKKDKKDNLLNNLKLTTQLINKELEKKYPEIEDKHNQTESEDESESESESEEEEQSPQDLFNNRQRKFKLTIQNLRQRIKKYEDNNDEDEISLLDAAKNNLLKEQEKLKNLSLDSIKQELKEEKQQKEKKNTKPIKKDSNKEERKHLNINKEVNVNTDVESLSGDESEDESKEQSESEDESKEQSESEDESEDESESEEEVKPVKRIISPRERSLLGIKRGYKDQIDDMMIKNKRGIYDDNIEALKAKIDDINEKILSLHEDEIEQKKRDERSYKRKTKSKSKGGEIITTRGQIKKRMKYLDTCIRDLKNEISDIEDELDEISDYNSDIEDDLSQLKYILKQRVIEYKELDKVLN